VSCERRSMDSKGAFATEILLHGRLRCVAVVAVLVLLNN
jgi:hypothetical protein